MGTMSRTVSSKDRRDRTSPGASSLPGVSEDEDFFAALASRCSQPAKPLPAYGEVADISEDQREEFEQFRRKYLGKVAKSGSRMSLAMRDASRMSTASRAVASKVRSASQ